MRDVCFAIEVMIETFYQESGHKPAGILIGPPEYRELCNRVKQSAGYLKQAQVEEALVTEYKGFPVYVKELPGLELMITYQEAFHAAYR